MLKFGDESIIEIKCGVAKLILTWKSIHQSDAPVGS
jgi:hypothetical protein